MGDVYRGMKKQSQPQGLIVGFGEKGKTMFCNLGGELGRRERSLGMVQDGNEELDS